MKDQHQRQLLSFAKKKEGPKIAQASSQDIEKSQKFVGAHVSSQGGVDTVFERAASVNGRAVAMFLKNQKTYAAKPLDPGAVLRFQALKTHDHILPHASYLINLAQPDPEKARRSYALFLDELKRCEQLGILLCNFHPGSNVAKLPIEQACLLISENINRAHRETSAVIVVIENMAGQGSVVGASFGELRCIIDGVLDKARVGVCLDTCHLFGAGYDIRTKESFALVMEEFDRLVGLSYLKGMHLNDSKMPLGSRKDRHESLGRGLIGLEAFAYVMTSPLFTNIPLILETPDPSRYREEISLLYGLSVGST
ncbi:hypothetical protein NEDG_01413 [Nematocida displodere]|uniref:Apurinic-apyrimidinic endonuclease 1 n=1 Tax=Nematocida displodere TaxID=1805483 RepID=A0A177ED73_9MICR|nr:hypothetical protein NEDG_01413 [Nematocida displodere]